METYTPLTQPEVAEEVTGETVVGISPIARLATRMVLDIAENFGREVIAPELTPQKQVRGSRSQQEELARLEIAIAEEQGKLLETQSPGRLMKGFFREDEIRADMAKLTAVRYELAQYTPAPAAPVFMEPREFVQQQAMGTKSAIGMMPQSLEGVRAALSNIAQPIQAGIE